MNLLLVSLQTQAKEALASKDHYEKSGNKRLYHYFDGRASAFDAAAKQLQYTLKQKPTNGTK